MKCKLCGIELDGMSDKLAKWGDSGFPCSECWKLANSTEPIPYEIVKPKVYSVDLDNTLTVGSAWTVDECENIEPREDAIRKINEIAEKNFVIIHTARRYTLARATMEWLDRNGVKYHAVRFGKMPCDVIFDLDAVNRVEDL